MEAWVSALTGVMRERGLDQYDVARMTGLSQQSVSKWVSGRYPVNLHRVAEIERKLNLPAGYLTGPLGFYPVDGASVSDAVLRDPQLDDEMRRTILSVYSNLIAIAGERKPKSP